MKKFLAAMRLRFIFIMFVAVALVAIATGNKHYKVTTYDMNRTKSLEAVHIVSKYDASVAEKAPVFASSLLEAVSLAADNDVIFNGTMTGYGPDCVGCSGRVGCAPYPNVSNGNITYNDASYGTVRIVAADASVPCGTIVKISNVTFTDEPFYAIVLDRGGAIKGTLFDLLFETEQDALIVGRQKNVQYEIQRLGW